MKNDLKSWQKKADLRLAAVLEKLATIPSLAKRPVRVPRGVGRQATVRLVGRAAMLKLNTQYRSKKYATDVLSFTVPELFSKMGILGELVICLPVLQAQAKAQKHSSAVELDVLLTHGVLHLLGFDHELGPRQAKEMARWEARLLGLLKGGQGLGLIERAHSGTKVK